MIEAYDATFMGQNVRQAQDNRLASLALMNSLTPTGRRSIRLQSSLYVVNGEPSANKLLRTIIQTSHVDTQATSATIRERLSNLDAAMAKYQNDVIRFNEYVVEQIDTLASRGETSSDLRGKAFALMLSSAATSRISGLRMMRVQPIRCRS